MFTKLTLSKLTVSILNFKKLPFSRVNDLRFVKSNSRKKLISKGKLDW
jgi:hypothetical protein